MKEKSSLAPHAFGVAPAEACLEKDLSVMGGLRSIGVDGGFRES